MQTNHIIRQEKRRVQPNRGNTRQQARQARLHRHTFILMIASSIVFVVTSLPISLRQIITAYQVSLGIITDISSSVTQEAVLTVLLTLNYTVSQDFRTV